MINQQWECGLQRQHIPVLSVLPWAFVWFRFSQSGYCDSLPRSRFLGTRMTAWEAGIAVASFSSFIHCCDFVWRLAPFSVFYILHAFIFAPYLNSVPLFHSPTFVFTCQVFVALAVCNIGKFRFPPLCISLIDL